MKHWETVKDTPVVIMFPPPNGAIVCTWMNDLKKKVEDLSKIEEEQQQQQYQQQQQQQQY